MGFLKNRAHLTIVILTIALGGIDNPLKAQKGKGAFKQLSCFEMAWAIGHPFKVARGKRTSQEALDLYYQVKDTLWPSMQGVSDSADAFRHALWMVLLSESMSAGAAYRLGLAHEKANYRQMKKGELEDGSQIEVGFIQMDLHNNLHAIQAMNCQSNSIESATDFALSLVRSGVLKVNPESSSIRRRTLFKSYRIRKVDFTNCSPLQPLQLD